MDFASALANLEKTAQEAARSSSNNNNKDTTTINTNAGNNNTFHGDSRRRQRSPEPSYDRRQRPRHPYDSRSPPPPPPPPHYHQHRNYTYNPHSHSHYQHQHSQQSYNPLSGLIRAGYTVAPYRPVPPPSDATTRPKHIALLAITIDDLPYEHIWREWCCQMHNNNSSNNNDNNTIHYVSLLCHAKYPHAVTSKWLQRRLLVEPPIIGRGNSWADPVYRTHKPEWGSVQITCAMMDLVRAALEIGTKPTTTASTAAAATASKTSSSALAGIPDLEDDVRFSSKRFLVNHPDDDKDIDSGSGTLPSSVPPVDKMIFISETCLPVTSLEDCIHALFGDEQKQHQQHVVTTVAEMTAGGNDKNGTTAEHQTKGNTLETTTMMAVLDADKEKPATIEGSGNDDDNMNYNSSKVKNPGSTQAASTSAATTTIRFNPYETSWVNARNRNTPGTPRNMYERDQFSNIHRMVPHFCRWKADQWLVLSRPHANAIAAMDQHFLSRSHKQLWNSFSKINASDEMYFPTCLAILQILTESSMDNSHQQQVIKRPVTFTDWSEGMRNPATYRRGGVDFRKIAKLARAKGCLFARKFVPSLDIPGQETVVTGQISVEEWNTVLDALAERGQK